MGDYPSLEELNETLGDMTAAQWLTVQLVDLSIFAGVKNMDKAQIDHLSRKLAQEYKSLKYSEFQLFFYRFKMGDFGMFYGAADPMMITCALKKFLSLLKDYRNDFLQEEYRRQDEERQRIRQANIQRWHECREVLAAGAPDDKARSVFQDLDLDFHDESSKTLIIYATKEQYEMIENKLFDYFQSVFRQFYPDFKLNYRLYEKSLLSIHIKRNEKINVPQKDNV